MMLTNKDPKSIAAMIVMRKSETDSNKLKESNEKMLNDTSKNDGLSAVFSEFAGAMKDGKEIVAMGALKSFVEMCVANYSTDSDDTEEYSGS